MLKELYKIKVTDNGISSSLNYQKFATNKSIFKIYIVKFKSNILYVGITTQRISERFSQSFRAFKIKQKTGFGDDKGYSGYKWILDHKNTGHVLDLFIFAFPEYKKETDTAFIEAIEAEIAFFVRFEKGRWPENQNEIHFNNLKGAKEIAKNIYSLIE